MTTIRPNLPIARQTRPGVAAQAPRILAVARQEAPRGGDALADGLAAANPDAFRVALIRLAAEGRDAEARAGNARTRFDRDEIAAPELRSAEADLAKAYDRLKTLHDSAEGSRGIKWKAQFGFDLNTEWEAHGIKLPVAPKKIVNLARRAQIRQIVGAVAGVGGLFGFAVFAQATSRSLAAIGFGGFVLGALISAGLMLIDNNRR